jgi:hypothetical protein
MGTSGFALIALVQSGEPQQWSRWILLATLIPLFLLSVAILATINKARAINIRSGYVAAAGYYLWRGKNVPNFGGWINALRAAHTCANLTFLSYDDSAPCKRYRHEYCSTKAQNNAEFNNKTGQTWRRDVIKSFTVLTSIVYAVLYIIVSASVITAAIITVDWEKQGWDWRVLAGGFIFAACTFLAIMLAFFRKQRGITSALLVACYLMLLTGGLGLLVATVFKCLPTRRGLEWTNMFGLGGGLLFIVGLAILLYDQIYKVRKGEYSLETYYQLWRRRFEDCPLMAGSTVYVAGEKAGRRNYTCLNYKCRAKQNIANDGLALVACQRCGHSLFHEDA